MSDNEELPGRAGIERDTGYVPMPDPQAHLDDNDIQPVAIPDRIKQLHGEPEPQEIDRSHTRVGGSQAGKRVPDIKLSSSIGQH